MKTCCFTLALSVFALTNAIAQATQADEKVIRKTVEDSRAAFDKRDLNAFASYFVNSPDLYYQVSTGDHQVILAHGTDNMKKMVGGHFQNTLPATQPGSYKFTNFHLRMKDNFAFVTTGGEIGDEHSRDFIVLEKVGGSWKVSALTAQFYEVGKLTEVK